MVVLGNPDTCNGKKKRKKEKSLIRSFQNPAQYDTREVTPRRRETKMAGKEEKFKIWLNNEE